MKKRILFFVNFIKETSKKRFILVAIGYSASVYTVLHFAEIISSAFKMPEWTLPLPLQ